MEFGIFGSHDTSLAASVRTWRRINEIGIGAIGVVDSPLLLREAFVSLATLALQTDTPRLFSCVMNTITRDPTVVAGGYQGLRDLAGDRVSLAFGAGDSSTHGVGLGTASLAHMEEFIRAVRGLLRGESVQYQGRALRGSWRDVEPFEPHLMVSAHGRRSLEMAGRVADGVISGFGLLPETVAEASRIVRTSAEQAGRDPDAIEMWHVAFFSPADTVEEGFVYANGAGAAILSRGGLTDKLVPEHLQDKIREVGATWTLDKHARANQETADVAVRNGSIDYLVQRAGGLIGPVDVPAALERWESYGVERVMFVAIGADRDGLIEQLGRGIAGHVPSR